MTRLARSLCLIAAVAVLPRAARATPATLAALPTVAVANDSGVAESLAVPSGSTTTKVTVEVSTRSDEANATAATPAPSLPPSMTGYVPPPVDPYAEQARDDRKTGRSLLAAGLTVAGGAYLFSSLSGALAIDRARDLEGRRATQRRAFGRALLVPGIGPAVAIARADRAVRAWAAGVAGLTQALGAGLALVGVHRLVRARRLERLSLSAMGSSTQAHVSLQVRF